MQGGYWNRREVMWWTLIVATLTAYAVAVFGFGVDSDPWTWLD